MSMLSKARALLTGALPLAAPVAEVAETRPRAGASYMRGGRGVTFAQWRPALREAQDDIADVWDDAAARAFDAIHNSGWLAGAIEQAVANTVGPGLRLKAIPENTTFGMTEQAARQWGLNVERRFELWARNAQECDVEGMRSFGKLQAAAFRSWLATGEILAELPWRKRAWNRYGTKVRLLPSQRLSRKTEKLSRLTNGVFTDADGMPIAYLAIRKDIFMGDVETVVRARDSAGRPRVIHVFDGVPGTHRGISPMVPALQVARQFDQLADATLTAAILKTLFAATITGDAPTEEILQGLLTPQEQARMMADGSSPFEAYLDMVGGFYDSATLNLGINGRLSHLFPGQELKLHTSDHPGEDYKTYSSLLLRELARCLGLTFESATGDYTGATYSSVRMATGEIYALTKMRREHIVAPFCQAAYEAWLEEEIAAGAIPFPGGLDAFLANRAAACRAEWRGAPKPQADDLKAAKAHEVWKRLGVISDEVIANDLGHDIEDVYAMRARERELRAFYGLPDDALMASTGGAPGNPGTAQDEEDDGKEDDPEDDDPEDDQSEARDT